MLDQENAELERELAELQGSPAPIITLTQTHGQFLADSKRFTEYIHSLDEQMARQKTVLREKNAELDQRMIQLEAAETERLRLAVSKLLMRRDEIGDVRGLWRSLSRQREVAKKK